MTFQELETKLLQLTPDEKRHIIQVLTDSLQDDDDPDTILPELRQSLLQQRERRQSGQTKPLSAAEALQALDLDDE